MECGLEFGRFSFPSPDRKCALWERKRTPLGFAVARVQAGLRMIASFLDGSVERFTGGDRLAKPGQRSLQAKAALRRWPPAPDAVAAITWATGLKEKRGGAAWQLRDYCCSIYIFAFLRVAG